MLTLLVQAPTADALHRLFDDFPAFEADAERLGCVVRLVTTDDDAAAATTEV